MSVLYILFAFGLLASGQATGDELCPNRTRDPDADAMWNRCLYYCSDGGDGWLTGYFPDGTWCYYDVGQENGTCYKGYCYWNLPEDATIPSTMPSRKVNKKEKSSKGVTSTEPTTTDDTTTMKSQNEKKKEEKEDEKKKEKEKKKEGKKESKKKKPKTTTVGTDNLEW